jgi:predicted kinase
MSGIPASGKSTYIEEHQLENDLVCSRDNFRTLVRIGLGSSDYFPVSAEREWFLWLGHVNSELIIYPARDIWIDQTTNGIGAFEKIYKDLFLTDYDEIIIHIFETPYEVCLARNAKRHGYTQVPQATMESMQDGFVRRNITRAKIKHPNVKIVRHLADGKERNE